MNVGKNVMLNQKIYNITGDANIHIKTPLQQCYSG